MTTIAWDGYDIAIDGAVNDGVTKLPAEKMWGEDWKVALAGTGSTHDVGAMKEWVTQGRNSDKFPKVAQGSCFVVVSPDKGLFRYTISRFPIAHGFKPCAFGSGADFALGALFMGADAVTAIKAAKEYDPNTGHQTLVFRIRRRPSGYEIGSGSPL
jgi:hypothetical protein